MTCPGELVRIDDTALWVVSRGDPSGYPIIVLHGGPGLDHHMYGHHLDPLTDDGYRLLLVDERAQGKSEPAPESTWTLERHAQDVIMLARALGLERYAVLGHSYGAFIALQNAVDYPGMASQTIVSAGLPSARFLARVWDSLAAFEPEELREQVTSSWEQEKTMTTQEEAAQSLADQWPFHFRDPRDPRIAEMIASDETVHSPDVIRHFANADYGGIELEDRLAEITQPVLVLAGRHDRTCVPEGAEIMATGIPRSELVIFEQSAHMMFVEEHDAYLDAVRGFLSRTR
jgi:proline iminopeptidase